MKILMLILVGQFASSFLSTQVLYAAIAPSVYTFVGTAVVSDSFKLTIYSVVAAQVVKRSNFYPVIAAVIGAALGNTAAFLCH